MTIVKRIWRLFMDSDAYEARELLRTVERNRWCLIPPNQETPHWSVYRCFDGEFGYQDEVATGATLMEALSAAAKAIR